MSLSSAASGTLFMATANPATLMAMGTGVGSAVMSGGSIVAQAPFIPVKSALMPVVAPVLAFQCLTTIAILGEFAEVKKGIADIQRGISRMMERQEATFIGEALSACQRVEQLEQEFDISNSFTTDMIVRLALLENSVNPVFERHSYLYKSTEPGQQLSGEDWGFKQGDAKMAVALSLLDLRLDVLRVKLAIQENPGFVQTFADGLRAKISRYDELWTDIENAPKAVEGAVTDLRKLTEGMSWWGKKAPGWLGGQRATRKDREKRAADLNEMKSVDSTMAMIDGARNAAEAGKDLQEKLETVEPMSLFYWEDEMGKHCYYTDDVCVR
jgi:hypothetical protein